MDDKELEGIKGTIKTIEGFFHAVNAASFPLRWYEAAVNGMSWLNAVHVDLVKKLPKEEIEKVKSEQSQAPVAEAPKPIEVVQ